VVAQIDKLLRERMRVVKVLVNAVRPGIDALVERLLVEKELEGADASETFHKALEAAGVKVPTPEEALAVVEAEDAAKPKEETPSDAAIDAILKAVKAQQTKA
jgi:hypothetical protein